MWTRERMSGYLKRRLGDRRLIVVANREPYLHEQTPSGIRCTEPDGGLISILDAVLRATGGTWIAHSTGSGDRQTVDDQSRLRVPPGSDDYTLRRVWLNREEEDAWYYRCCHEGLWPLCHAAYHPPRFDLEAWERYVRVNEKFAQAIVEEAGSEKCLVLVQNYHFALLPKVIRSRINSSIICHFWHIPWPPFEIFRNCPWRKEILDGLLGSDLVSFQLEDHCSSFLEAVRREAVAEGDPVQGEARRSGRTTLVRPDPISVDSEDLALAAHSVETRTRCEEWRARLSLGDQRILLSVGRFDYTEGVPERIRAFSRLLDVHPEYRGKIALLEVAIPIRGNLPTYTRFQSEAIALIEEVNKAYGTDTWRPIIVISEHQSRRSLVALYQLADICLVTPVHDGMSLIAKEYVAARPDGRGALILSANSGAARELQDAILVNPFDIPEMSGAMRHALELSGADRETRFQKLRSIVASRNVFRWAGKLLRDALAVPSPTSLTSLGHGKAAREL